MAGCVIHAASLIRLIIFAALRDSYAVAILLLCFAAMMSHIRARRALYARRARALARYAACCAASAIYR